MTGHRVHSKEHPYVLLPSFSTTCALQLNTTKIDEIYVQLNSEQNSIFRFYSFTILKKIKLKN